MTRSEEESQAGLKADWLCLSAQILSLTKPRLWSVSCIYITEFRAIWTLKYCPDFFLLSHNFLTMLLSSMAFFCWQAVLCLLEWWKGIINTWQFLSFLIKYMTANGPVIYLNKPFIEQRKKTLLSTRFNTQRVSNGYNRKVNSLRIVRKQQLCILIFLLRFTRYKHLNQASASGRSMDRVKGDTCSF